MDGHVLTDVSTFGPSTQYEVTNWLFGRGNVAPASARLSHRDGRIKRKSPRGRGGQDSRRYLDVAGPRPRRHSSHSGSALYKERQMTTTLNKSHKRTHSSGYYLSPTQAVRQERGQDEIQKEVHMDGKDAVMAGHKRHSVHSRHRRTSSQRSGHRFSFWRAQRDSMTSNAGSGDTLIGSSEDLESLSPSPTCLRFSAGSVSKPTPYLPSPSFTYAHSPALDFPTPPSNTLLKPPCFTNLHTSTSPLHFTKNTSYLRSTHNDVGVSPQSITSSDSAMDEKSRVFKALNAFKQCKTSILSNPLLLSLIRLHLHNIRPQIVPTLLKIKYRQSHLSSI